MATKDPTEDLISLITHKASNKEESRNRQQIKVGSFIKIIRKLSTKKKVSLDISINGKARKV